MLQITAIKSLVVIADAPAVGANASGELAAIVTVASISGVIVLWSLNCRYQQAIASNRVRIVQDLEERYQQCKSRAEALLARANSECRDFTPNESHEFVHLMDKYDDLQLELKRAKERMPSEEPPLPPAAIASNIVTSHCCHRAALAYATDFDELSMGPASARSLRAAASRTAHTEMHLTRGTR